MLNCQFQAACLWMCYAHRFVLTKIDIVVIVVKLKKLILKCIIENKNFAERTQQIGIGINRVEKD